MSSPQQPVAVGQEERGGASIAGRLITLSVAGESRAADVDLPLHVGTYGQEPPNGIVNQLSAAYL